MSTKEIRNRARSIAYARALRKGKEYQKVAVIGKEAKEIRQITKALKKLVKEIS